MKWAGIVAVLLSLWWRYLWRYDPVEGVYMRGLATFGVVVGSALFLEGLKREIIRCICKRIEDVQTTTQ